MIKNVKLRQSEFKRNHTCLSVRYPTPSVIICIRGCIAVSKTALVRKRAMRRGFLLGVLMDGTRAPASFK